MGEAKRKAKAGNYSKKEWNAFVDHVEAVHAEGGGVWANYVFHHYNVPPLLVESLAGDELATRYLRGIYDVLTGVFKASRTTRPVLCLCCPREIHEEQVFSVCLTVPYRDDPSRCLGSAICHECASVDAATLSANVLTVMRKLIPDARIIEPSDVTGHA